MPRSRGRKGPPTETSYGGRVVLYADRGRLIARKWPKKRGTPKSPLVREQNEWFRIINQLVKRAPAEQQIIAIEITKNSGIYPRDILMAAASSGIANRTNPDGSGVVYRRQRSTEMSWEGARVERVNNFILPAGVTTIIPWETALVDTSGYFDAANPNVLTVPDGPFLAEFTAGVFDQSNTPGTCVSFIVSSRLGQLCRVDQTTAFTNSMTMTTGPTLVQQGDQIDLRVFDSSGATLLAGNNNWLAVTTLLVLGDNP